jgi:uncharacterized protein (TIRG00374 family)
MVNNQISKVKLWFKQRWPKFRWAGAVLLIGLIGLFFYKNRGELKSLKGLKVQYILTLLLLQVGAIILHATRLRLLVQKFAINKISYGRWLHIFMVGRFLNMFVAQGGNVYRTVTLKAAFGLPHTHYIGCLLTFAWLDTILNLCLAGISILFLHPDLRLGPVRADAAIAAILFCTLVSPFLLSMVGQKTNPRNKILGWISNKVKLLLDGCWMIITDTWLLVSFIFLGIGSCGIMAAALGISFTAIGTRLSISQLLLLYSLYKLSIYIMVTPGNLGIREVSLAAVCGLMNINISAGLLSSIIIRLCHYLTLVFLIVLTWLIAGIRKLCSHKEAAPEPSK